MTTSDSLYEKLKSELEGITLYHESDPNEYFSIFCPWHEDVNTPSLLVYRDPERWRCLAGCGQGPSLYDLWRKLQTWKKPVDKDGKPIAARGRGSPYLPADVDDLQTIADTAHEYMMGWRELGWYLDQRGVGGAIVPYRLGYYKGWITIPVLNPLGKLKSLVLRSTPPIQEATGLRFHSPPMPPMLYCPDWARVVAIQHVYIVFGMIDALSLAVCGLPVMSPTHGNQSIQYQWFDGVLKDKKYCLVPDRPEHEMEETRERTIIMQNAGLRAGMLLPNYPEGCKDMNDVLVKFGAPGVVTVLGLAKEEHA